jgi:hypothetical protein
VNAFRPQFKPRNGARLRPRHGSLIASASGASSPIARSATFPVTKKCHVSRQLSFRASGDLASAAARPAASPARAPARLGSPHSRQLPPVRAAPKHRSMNAFLRRWNQQTTRSRKASRLRGIRWGVAAIPGALWLRGSPSSPIALSQRYREWASGAFLRKVNGGGLWPDSNSGPSPDPWSNIHRRALPQLAGLALADRRNVCPMSKATASMSTMSHAGSTPTCRRPVGMEQRQGLGRSTCS